MGAKDWFNNWLRLVLIVGVVSLSTGCSRGNKIKIVSISPDPSRPLQVGKSYDVSVEVDYSLIEKDALLILDIRKDDLGQVGFWTLRSNSWPISKGSGKMTLGAQITVGKMEWVKLSVFFSYPGVAQSEAIETRKYKVVEG